MDPPQAGQATWPMRLKYGEMAEWSNAAVSKTVVPQSRDRGFESPSLRSNKIHPAAAGGRDFVFT